MARLFQTSWSQGNLTSEGTAVIGAPVVQAVVTHGEGVNAIEIKPAGSAKGLSYQFASGVSGGPYFARVMFRLHSLTTTTTILGFGTSSGAVGCGRIDLTNTGTLQLRDGAAGLIGTSAVLSLDTWYCLEIEANATPASGSRVLIARLDTVQFASSSTLTSTQLPTMDFFSVGGNLASGQAAASGDWFFDDLAINDSTGAGQTSWPGPGSVIEIRPNALGDNDGWLTQVGGTAGTANNYTRVNELVSDGLTSYNASVTLSVIDDHKFESVPAGVKIGSQVNVVAVGVSFAGASTTSEASFKLRLKKAAGGTVVSSGTAITPSSQTFALHSAAIPHNYGLVTYLDPDGAAWTPSTLNTLQAGYTITATSTNADRISTLWVSIDFAYPTTTLTAPASMALQTTQTLTSPASMQLSTSGNVLTAPASMQLSTTSTQKTAPASMALGVTGSSRTAPASMALQPTSSRSAPASMALQPTTTRSAPAFMELSTSANQKLAPASMALSTITNQRTAPASMALRAVSSTRTAPTSMTLRVVTATRTTPASMALQSSHSRSSPASIALEVDATPRIAPASLGLQIAVSVTAPAFMGVRPTLARSAPASMELSITNALIAPASMALLVTSYVLAPASVALEVDGVQRTAPASLGLQVSQQLLSPASFGIEVDGNESLAPAFMTLGDSGTRNAPASTALQITASVLAPASAALSSVAKQRIAPASMELSSSAVDIARDAPASMGIRVTGNNRLAPAALGLRITTAAIAPASMELSIAGQHHVLAPAAMALSVTRQAVAPAKAGLLVTGIQRVAGASFALRTTDQERTAPASLGLRYTLTITAPAFMALQPSSQRVAPAYQQLAVSGIVRLAPASMELFAFDEVGRTVSIQATDTSHHAILASNPTTRNAGIESIMPVVGSGIESTPTTHSSGSSAESKHTIEVSL